MRAGLALARRQTSSPSVERLSANNAKRRRPRYGSSNGQFLGEDFQKAKYRSKSAAIIYAAPQFILLPFSMRLHHGCMMTGEPTLTRS
jgi:hypothetical protein